MTIYDPTADKLLEVEKPKKYISSWSIRVEWDNGLMEDIADVPDDAAQIIDEWLTEIEQAEEQE
jgi:hypothetical protein